MDFQKLKNEMVNTQLIARGIRDKRILDAFRRVPRHEFVPNEVRASAYEDHPLPIGEGQTISQPYMAALMTECLDLKGSEKVLEIGTGSGYQLAILAELAREVFSVERIKDLADRSRCGVQRLGYNNIKVKNGDGTLGWEDAGPFDAIMVTAGSPQTPKSLLRQLGNGGRLIIPIGGSFSQMLTVFKKRGDALLSSEVCGCVFVPLIGKEGWRQDA